MSDDQGVSFSVLCNFREQQWVATDQCDNHRYFLFGGRRGVLKSYWLRWYLLRRLLIWFAQGHHSVRVALVCEDYPTLTDRQVTKIRQEFPPYIGEIKTTKIDGFGFHLNEEYGGGVIAFRSLDDPLKMKGSEYAGVGIEELTHNGEYVEQDLRFIDVLDGSLRWPNISDSFLACTSNPDGKGQVWVREFFIEKKLPDSRKHQANRICYLKGTLDDKNLLPPEYWDAIGSVGEKLRRAWVDGDWYVNFGGALFKREWFKILPGVPSGIVNAVRYWDKAGTQDGGKNSAGVLLTVTDDGRYVVVHCVAGQWSSFNREHIIKQTAQSDRSTYGYRYSVGHEQEPGSGGKHSAESTNRSLAGFSVKADRVTKSKDDRDRGLEPFAVQAELGNVWLVEGDWNNDYIDELCLVPNGRFRDRADASGGAFNMICNKGTGISI